MNIKLNSFYKRRDGRIVRIVAEHDTVLFPFKDEGGNSYARDGCYLVDKRSSPVDLVEEVASYPVIGTGRPALPAQAPAPKSVSKHADIIKKWAEGEQIQCKGKDSTEWRDILSPGKSYVQWLDSAEYRVKPVPHKWQNLMDLNSKGLAPLGFEMRLPGSDRWVHVVTPDFDHPTTDYRVKTESRHREIREAYNAAVKAFVESRGQLSWPLLQRKSLTTQEWLTDVSPTWAEVNEYRFTKPQIVLWNALRKIPGGGVEMGPSAPTKTAVTSYGSSVIKVKKTTFDPDTLNLISEEWEAP
jgi:hypothetical protein